LYEISVNVDSNSLGSYISVDRSLRGLGFILFKMYNAVPLLQIQFCLCTKNIPVC